MDILEATILLLVGNKAHHYEPSENHKNHVYRQCMVYSNSANRKLITKHKYYNGFYFKKRSSFMDLLVLQSLTQFPTHLVTRLLKGVTVFTKKNIFDVLVTEITVIVNKK